MLTMISIYSVLFPLVLFSDLNSHLVTVAMPATKLEGGTSEQDAEISPLYRRSLVLDSVRDEDGNPKIIVAADARLKGRSVSGLSSAFNRNLHLLAGRSLNLTPAEYSLEIDRRDPDLDMLRCMIGRVYRPCWEA